MQIRNTYNIYIGSQRIVSKLGDMDSYGADPRRIEYAGTNVDKVNVDYEGKYTTAQEVNKDRFDKFEVPYLGEDNNDYVNGEGFCCTDVGNKTANKNIGAGNDNPELYQYYYHSDHLGSASYITNLEGEIVQHIEYIPFGEVFIEERNNTWNTPFLFNGKELDEETGLYYYGARYYNPRESVWLSVDPLAEQTMTPYQYTYQNPVRYIDPTGMNAEPPTQTEGNDPIRFDRGHVWADDSGVYRYDAWRPREDGVLGKELEWTKLDISADEAIEGAENGYTDKRTKATTGITIALPVGGTLKETILGTGMRILGAFGAMLTFTGDTSFPITDTGYRYSSEPIYVYRNMRTAYGIPELGDNSLNQLGLRPRDVFPKAGMTSIYPWDGLGMSVTPPGMSKFTPFGRLGVTTMYKLDIRFLPLFGLSYFQDSPTHAVVTPLYKMSVDDFRTKIKSTVLFWQPVIK